MVLTLLALVAMFLGLIGIYALNVFAIKSIIRDIAFNIWYFAKDHDKLTLEAIRNITWHDHDKLFWLVTLVWLLSMFCGAIFTLIMFMNFG